MAAVKKHDIPDGFYEEYYQISPDILASFNRYRPPLNIYRFKEDLARVIPYYKVGGRLSAQQVEELAELTAQGAIFVSRADHPVYVKHISYQLDLVLVDANLKEKEIADIFTQALTRRLGEFFDQPVAPVFQRLWVDLMVLTEYLYADINRARALARRLHVTHSLEKHSLNCGFLGLALLGKLKGTGFAEAVARKTFDRLALGLFLHDLGMTKVPAFIRGKEKTLTTEERSKINAHTRIGYEMLTKLDIRFPEVEQCVSQHHERLDGSGYPAKASRLDFAGRLCAVVDSFCAMITKRPHAEAMDMVKAAALLAADDRYDMEMTRALQALLMLDLKMK